MKIQKRKETVKRIYDDKKKSVKQYIKEKYVENRTSNIAYKKAMQNNVSKSKVEYQKKKKIIRHQENPEIQNINKWMWQGSEFPATSKIRTLIYLHIMPSKLASGTYQII